MIRKQDLLCFLHIFSLNILQILLQFPNTVCKVKYNFKYDFTSTRGRYIFEIGINTVRYFCTFLCRSMGIERDSIFYVFGHELAKATSNDKQMTSKLAVGE